MEPDTVEIALPSCSNTLTSNKAANPEVNDVEEQYEMQNGGDLNNNGVDNKNKGKAIQVESPSYDDEYAGSASDYYDTTNNNDAYPGSSPMSNSLLDPDSLIYDDDYDYSDQYAYEMEEEETETDDYSMYQDLFDGKDIPTGVEVSMDWFPNETEKSSENSKSSLGKKGNTSDDATGSSSKKATKGSRTLSSITPNPAYSLPHNGPGFQYSAQPFTLGSTTSKPLKNSPNHLQPQTPDTVMGEAPTPAPAPAPVSSGMMLPLPTSSVYFKSSRPKVDEVISAPDDSRVKRNMEDYLGKYLFFKRFDIVEDFSDHHYATRGTTSKRHTKEWAKRIQEEWRILENDLPEMIFVRAYESRMDLLRAVIIGADGTPYHDGLFFFDIFFPDTYPSVPPTVHYHSGGLRINPNLYNCGKVCLSLLGTWSGSQREKWIPNDSTMLQVLVSIQGLILNKDPYFNEPGFERTAGSANGELQSKYYSENTFLLSLKTMVYNMRRPPKYFEEFSYGHFFSCAHEVLKACNAYRNGAPVASLVRGAVIDGEDKSKKCSDKFGTDVANIVETFLLKEFILLGVLGLEPKEGEEEEEEEKKPCDTNKVAESSSSSSRRTRSSAKRDRVASS